MSGEKEKYTVAWFKLAEFVWRKEKERALGLYKLLAHSLHDTALIAQLEGDLLLAFNDKKGLYAYERAAMLYEKQERFACAIALYEVLACDTPDRLEYAAKLMNLQSRLKKQDKFIAAADHLITLIIAQKAYQDIDSFAQVLPDEYYKIYYEKITIGLMQVDAAQSIIKNAVIKSIEKKVTTKKDGSSIRV